MNIPTTTLPPAQVDLSNRGLIATTGDIGGYLLPISTFVGSIINGEYYDTAKIALFALIQKIQLVAIHNFFQRIRPDGIVGSTFPSDATAFAFFAVGYCFRKAPATVTMAATTAAALVGLSKYMTGAYWPTDILLGAALGIVNGMLATVKYIDAERLPREVNIRANLREGEGRVHVD